MIDLIAYVNQVVVLIMVIIFLAIGWKYRERIMLALTGDVRLHGSFLDFMWWGCFRCCGTCSGEWTRCLTKLPCCDAKIRGTNLVKSLGQFWGFTAHSVELRNIVIGDLPYDGRGSFYIQIFCASNPAMVTSLAEDRLPKVVHFPEVLTLRLRDSHFEEQVRISILVLDVLGSTELCSVYISAQTLLHWAFSTDPKDKMKRLEMKVLDVSLEKETPPWIFAEFDAALEDVRELNRLAPSDELVRTATQTHTYEQLDLAGHKHKYALLDPNGHAIQEPMEEDLRSIHRLRMCAVYSHHLCNVVVTTTLIIYWLYRGYVWSCFTKFEHITQAYFLNATGEQQFAFPMSLAQLEDVGASCEAQTEGTGIAYGKNPCRPSEDQVEMMCEQFVDIPGSFFNTSGQPWPAAMRNFIETYLPQQLQVPGIACHPGVCQVHANFINKDIWIFAISILLLLGVLFLRCMCNECIRSQKSRLQRQRTDEATKFRQKTLQEMQNSTWFSSLSSGVGSA